MSNNWLIIHAGALGDLVLTLQLALRLPGLNRDGRLHLLARVTLPHLEDARPAISQRNLESCAAHLLYKDNPLPPQAPLTPLIRGANVLNALGDTDSTPHKRLRELEPKRLLSLDPRPRPDSSAHITTQWEHALNAQGALLDRCVQRKTHDQATLRLPPTSTIRKPNRKNTPTKTLITIHPGSGGRAKCWPLDSFRQVADALARAGIEVLFILGPAELDRWNTSDITQLETAWKTLKNPDPQSLAQLLASADAFLGNDAGPAHLAALLGTPPITLFGPTDARIWHPRAPQGHPIQGDPAIGPNWGIHTADVLAAIHNTITPTTSLRNR